MPNGVIELLSPDLDDGEITGIGIGSDDMVENNYTNQNIRDRIEIVNERVIKAEGRQLAHEAICIELNRQVLKDIAELRVYITMVAKVGFWLAILLFGVELGKATFPALFDALLKISH